MTNFTLTIDRLIVTDLDHTAAQAEALQGQLAASLQRAAAQRKWSPAAATVQSDRLRLPDVQVGDNGRLPVADIAQNLVQALPGTSEKRG